MVFLGAACLADLAGDVAVATHVPEPDVAGDTDHPLSSETERPNRTGPSSVLNSVPSFPRSGMHRHRMTPKGETDLPWQDRISLVTLVGQPTPTEQYRIV